jgi:uncharacterized repeat protein (TIGR01451 family)
MKYFLILICALVGTPAVAQDALQLKNEVFVEKTVIVDGKQKIVREKPNTVVPGDKLVFIITYQNKGSTAVSGFELNNPVPEAVAYAGDDEPRAEVSIDKGQTFGALANLQVQLPDGTKRPAVAADVTNLRWKFSRAIAAGETGNLSFFGRVK